MASLCSDPGKGMFHPRDVTGTHTQSRVQGTHVVLHSDARTQHASHCLKWLHSARDSGIPLTRMAPNLLHQSGQLPTLSPTPGSRKGGFLLHHAVSTCDGDT